MRAALALALSWLLISPSSNGGEYHSYAVTLGVPVEMVEHFQIALGDETYGLMHDPNLGMVLEDPEQEGVPFMPSFAPTEHWGGDGPPAESDSDYAKRMEELEHESFAMGMGYGGLDMVTSTGKAIWGTAKFIGRAHLQVGLRFKWVGQWMTGGDTTRTEEMMVEVDEKQQEVIDQGLALGKFLGTLLVDTAAILPKVEVGLLTGDVELIQTALHGSETHRKIFDMCAEVLTRTTEDLSGENRTPGQKGYVMGKIVYEVSSFLLPFTKAGTLMQVTKSQVLGKLIGKSGLLRPGAQQVATAVKVAVDASQMCFVAGTPVLTQSGWMRIEDIRPGMWVWSRDEHDGAVAWKRVRHTFITHPAELYRLTYELRGPPESGPPSPRAESETLGVTAPHPFWVCNREQPAFIEAEQLDAGDELLTADGRRAVVMSKVLEQAPAGRTFTTYNFEVEDYHTYFAGRKAVWVHNHAVRQCQLARSTIRSMVEVDGRPVWDSFRRTLDMVNHDDLSSRARLRIFNETRQKYLNNHWAGGTPPWDASLRHVQTINARASSTTLGRNMKAVGIDAPWEYGGTMVQAHHIVPGGARSLAADEARDIIRNAGIDINEAANGVFLPKSADYADLGAVVHNGRHTDDYINRVRNRLVSARDSGRDIRRELQMIASELVNGSFSL